MPLDNIKIYVDSVFLIKCKKGLKGGLSTNPTHKVGFFIYIYSMIRIKKFLESVEHDESISEIEDFFVYSDLGDRYDIEVERIYGYHDLSSGRVKNIAKVVILNNNSIGMRDFIEDAKQTISRMEKLSDHSVSIVTFHDYGFHYQYEDIRSESFGVGLKSAINGNVGWKRIILFVYNKTIPKGIPYTHRKD